MLLGLNIHTLTISQVNVKKLYILIVLWARNVYSLLETAM
jgi:hypothetical protein